MSSGPDILIVGGGVAGLSTAWHLTRRSSQSVRLLERAPTFGTESSGKNAAILRTACGDPVELELALRGARFLQAPPPSFSPHALVHRHGLVLTGRGDEAERLADWVAAMPGDVRGRALDAAGLKHIAPFFRAAESASDLRAWHFPHEGRLDTRALVDGYARAAREGGARLETNTSVHELLVAGNRVEGVRLQDGSELRADIVVLAAGGWAGRLARRAGSPLALRPLRRHLLVTQSAPEIRPDWPVLWSLDERFYSRPESGGWLVCACDETEVDPDAAERDEGLRETLQERTRELYGFPKGIPQRFWFGLRTFSSDGRFLVGPDPQLDGLFWVGGLGGAGMVTSFEVGRLAAAGLCGDVPEDLARELDPRRAALTAEASA